LTADIPSASAVGYERPKGHHLLHKVIIDADAGIGDAAAIALALFDPGLDVVGITGTAGCVSGRAATRNLQMIIEQLDPPKWPRLGGSDGGPTLPAEGQDSFVGTAAQNGPSGLGDFDVSVAELHSPRESAKLLIDLVRDAPDEITLLTLGPLTNVDLARERSPEFLSQLKGLVCLGGAVECGGDVSAAAEFNIYSDPEAAQNVLVSPATKILVPLDVGREAQMTFEQFDSLPKSERTPVGRFLRELLPFALRAHHEHLGLEGVQLAEVAALASISQPHLVTTQSMVIDVETGGELTRGMTVFDRRPNSIRQPNIDVTTSLDTQGLFDYVRRIVTVAAG